MNIKEDIFMGVFLFAGAVYQYRAKEAIRRPGFPNCKSQVSFIEDGMNIWQSNQGFRRYISYKLNKCIGPTRRRMRA
jgi:hypothetical protein